MVVLGAKVLEQRNGLRNRRDPLHRAVGHVDGGLSPTAHLGHVDALFDQIQDQLVVATGGGICARFLAEAITAECGVPVTIANDPSGCVSRGLMRLMEERAA